jgi:hypothetical protein
VAAFALALGAWAGLGGPATADGVHVLTFHNDNARSGWNRDETALTPATVDVAHFGKVATISVDGDVYAQPLYVSGIPAGGKTRKLLLVATQHASVYAFDADDYTQVWHTDLVPGGSPVATGRTGDIKVPELGSSTPASYFDINPEVGVTGTPVIKLAPGAPLGGTLYVVTKKKSGPASAVVFSQELHALDLATGRERPGSPVTITASVTGTGTGRDDGHPELGTSQSAGRVVFNPLLQNQRSGLLLSSDGRTVYACWASHGDLMPYHGWIMGFEADSLAQVAVFSATPNGGRSGIWMGGAAPACDGLGNVYLATGNGTFETAPDAGGHPALGDYGTSVLKLVPDLSSTAANQKGNKNGWGLKVAGYFTPYNQDKMGGPGEDRDLGSGGVVLLDEADTAPRKLLAMAGKEGVIYLIDRDAMERFRFSPTKDDVFQRIPEGLDDDPPVGDVFGMPASAWSRMFLVGAPLHKASGVLLKDGPQPMRSFRVVAGRLDPAGDSKTADRFAWKTGTPTLSGPDLARGIVWIARAEGYLPSAPSTLHAFAASDLSRELYNSDMATGPGGSKPDQPGVGIKFAVPTVADGKVFLGCKKLVAVYGAMSR